MPDLLPETRRRCPVFGRVKPILARRGALDQRCQTIAMAQERAAILRGYKVRCEASQIHHRPEPVSTPHEMMPARRCL